VPWSIKTCLRPPRIEKISKRSAPDFEPKDNLRFDPLPLVPIAVVMNYHHIVRNDR